jgi:exodeoxyribonuclease VII small subunit
MTDKSDAKISEMSFEQALAALEDVVRNLEGGQVPLEQSIDLYERGEALRKHCEKRLKAAELRVEKIVADDGEAKGAEPFETS